MFYKYIKISPTKVSLTGIDVLLVADNERIKTINIVGQKNLTTIKKEWSIKEDLDLFLDVEAKLNQYFSGDKNDIKIDYSLTGTPFQNKVWTMLCQIPYGHTLSYKAFAQRIDPTSPTRAVASALAKNPLLFLLPCHRVIGSDGSLKGYAGGIELKRSLIKFEQNLLDNKL